MTDPIRFTDAQLEGIDQSLDQLEQAFVALVGLDPMTRRRLFKMGDKSEAFCRQASHVFTDNPGVLPGNFDLAGYQRDIATLDALRPRLVRLGKLHQRGVDTEMAVGSDLMTNALEGYAVLKVAGKGQGLDEARKALAARFARGPRNPAPASEPTPSEPLPA
jgi:hypothetical protein